MQLALLSKTAVIVIIFAIPAFFFARRRYRRKFGEDRSKVIVWSIFTSLLLSTIFILALIAGLIIWSINNRMSGYPEWAPWSLPKGGIGAEEGGPSALMKKDGAHTWQGFEIGVISR